MSWLVDAAAVVGCCLIVYGAAQAAPPLAWIAAGGFVLFAAWKLARKE